MENNCLKQIKANIGFYVKGGNKQSHNLFIFSINERN